MIISIIFFVVGFLTFSFTIIPVLICLFFGIPITNKLNKADLLVKTNPIIKGYWISISALTTIFLFISGLVYIFGPAGALAGYITGAILSFIIGVGQIGKNNNNMQDYIDTQSRYFNKPAEDVVKFLMK